LHSLDFSFALCLSRLAVVGAFHSVWKVFPRGLLHQGFFFGFSFYPRVRGRLRWTPTQLPTGFLDLLVTLFSWGIPRPYVVSSFSLIFDLKQLEPPLFFGRSPPFNSIRAGPHSPAGVNISPFCLWRTKGSNPATSGPSCGAFPYLLGQPAVPFFRQEGTDTFLRKKNHPPPPPPPSPPSLVVFELPFHGVRW